jgi:heterodisulfide reductase subunit B
MGAGDLRKYAIFTGCLIPSRFPFIEKASRMVLEELGVELHDLEGASCCPNQMAIQSSDKGLWFAIAARNLCLAEEQGHDILSLCNGCYDTLKTVNSRLKQDDIFRAEINELLGKHGLEFKGTVDVKHIVQVLHDEVGLNAIDKAVTIPLGRFSFAPFAGCHVRRPMDHMGFDDPEEPFYLKDLIRAAGGKVVPYPEQHSCCAGGFSIGSKDDVAHSARRVLRSIEGSGGDALVVNCPYCFAQFFVGEGKANEDYAEKMDLPILYITQLIGLGMGLDPDAMGMPLHYEKSAGSEEELVDSITKGAPDEDVFTAEVTRSQLEICSGCLACIDDCQTAMTVCDYRPEELLELVLQGNVEEAIRRPDIWYCINCHECVQRCPQVFGMVKLLVHLKNLAVASGICPEVVEHRMTELQGSGYSFAPDMEVREDLGLDATKTPEMDEFKRFLEEASKGCK